MKPPPVFLDANVFVAAAGRPEGGSAAVLDLCRAGVFKAVVSRQVLREAERNIREKLGTNALQRHYDRLRATEFSPVSDPTVVAVRRFARILNSKDAPILAAAVKSRSRYFVTLDRDFDPPAVRRAARPTVIVTPGELLGHLRAMERGT